MGWDLTRHLAPRRRSHVHGNRSPHRAHGRAVAVRRLVPRVRVLLPPSLPGPPPLSSPGLRSHSPVVHVPLVGCGMRSVLNTDNMSILGDTIDYGPYGFMDRHNPKFICNKSDNEGRYSYENQPKMCRWNCERLFEAWSPGLPDDASVEELLKVYDAAFQEAYLAQMRRKVRRACTASDLLCPPLTHRSWPIRGCASNSWGCAPRTTATQSWWSSSWTPWQPPRPTLRTHLGEPCPRSPPANALGSPTHRSLRPAQVAGHCPHARERRQ